MDCKVAFQTANLCHNFTAMFLPSFLSRIKSACIQLLMATGLLSACSKSKHAQWTTPADYYALPRWSEKVAAFQKVQHPPHTCTLFIGDSITEGFDVNYFFSDSTVVNMGIGGDFTQGVLRRLDPIVVLQPRKIFLMIGINDVLKREPVQVITDNHAKIVQSLRSQCPQAVIYIQSVLPIHSSYVVRDHGKKVNTQVVLDEIISINAQLQHTCTQYQATYVDLHKDFTNERGRLRKELTYDGLHLNHNGNQVWTTLIRPLMQ